MLSGGCYCGKVRYEAAEPRHETICHCADCRRIVGVASIAWFTVPRAAFRWTAGEPASFRSSSKAMRRFCGTCGTSLTFESEDTPGEIDITTASLDDPNAVPPKDHTHTGSRLVWDEICDGLPVYKGTRETS
jgi:hypothetical protein